MFTAIVVILMVLAILDLMVGVSNDAANFLNSAIGSKAAPRYVIMTVVSVGIILGAVFSSGMMEVARSGVFNPSMFTFQDVMMVFLAVMLTDVILLDLFNTFGLPTSTTVSLVFELLGASVAVALITISRSETAAGLGEYINSAKAFAIISGILISVVVAFVCGSVIMFFTRLLFTFNYKKPFMVFGPLWCGVAFTAISYFAVFKGLKDTSLISPETMQMLNDRLGLMILAMFAGWTVVSAILQYVFRVNTLKVTVLAGTFSLALAFAGNDLVNFIGVFMAGYDSYEMASAAGDVNMLMGDLSKPAVANAGILLAAGLIMAATLWFSKKAKAVSDTEVNLARQDAGVERFGSTALSRGIVRGALNMNKRVGRFMPQSVRRFVSKRFRNVSLDRSQKEKAPFDLIRATVNLTVASLLISMATSLRLPLSTTYVTFMVAMGSSLADRAWGRESAVYRITGVLTVVSGWFLTAVVAFTVAAVVACVLMWGGKVGILVMVGICVALIVQGSITFYKKAKRKEALEAEAVFPVDTEGKSVVELCNEDIVATMKKIIHIYNNTLIGLFNEDRKLLRHMVEESETLYESAHRRKHEVLPTLRKLRDDYIYTGHYYVQVVDYLDEATKALLHICRPSCEYIDNNHEGFNEKQIDDLMRINDEVEAIYKRIIYMLEDNNYEELDTILEMRDALFDTIAEAIMNQIRRTKRGGSNTKSGMLYLGIVNETKTMVLQSRNLLKAQKFFASNVQE